MNADDNDSVWRVPENVSAIYSMYQQGWGECGSEGGDDPALNCPLRRRLRRDPYAVLLSF